MAYKNMYGETCKPNYEVAYKTFSSMNKNAREDEDYETVSHGTNGTYRECVREAKRTSKDIGKKVLCGNTLELAEVAVVCYLNYDECSYDMIWEEVYKDGKKVGRYEF